MNIVWILCGVAIGLEMGIRGWSFYFATALVMALLVKKAFTPNNNAGAEQFGIPTTLTIGRQAKRIVEIIGSADKRGRPIRGCVEAETPTSFFVTPLPRLAMKGTTFEVPKVKVRVVRELAA